MTKVEAVVLRERVETVIDAVEHQTGHVGVTVVEAIGHGRQRGITHEYRGRIFESRFLPKAVLTFVVADERANAVVEAIVDAARSGNDSGDGIVWTTPVESVTHNRTGADNGMRADVNAVEDFRAGAKPRPIADIDAGGGTPLFEHRA